ncbi:hypothetical protein HMPREF1556_01961 [Porphyromonas sp. oral taxon 278 str. W7784]|nr:hypothetical protein HMPREF1556_01961 [Porphyromonas sp. oral taxon 278 str. W7784]
MNILKKLSPKTPQWSLGAKPLGEWHTATLGTKERTTCTLPSS